MSAELFCISSTDKDSDCIAAYKMYPDGTYEKFGEIENIAPELLSCEPHAIVLENGKIIVHIRVQNMGYCTIFQSESFDGGKPLRNRTNFSVKKVEYPRTYLC